MKHPWIDVQDQLPHDDELVLVCVRLRNSIGIAQSFYSHVEGRFTRKRGWSFDTHHNAEAFYWMPLPIDPPLPNEPKLISRKE